MNDEQGRHEAYSILWTQQAPTGEAPAWNGPEPSAELPPQAPAQQFSSQQAPAASSAGLSQQGLASPFGTEDQWAPPSGAPTAAELSQERPDNGGFGWDNHTGASRFSAPDAEDHAPREQAASHAYGYAPPAPAQPSYPQQPYGSSVLADGAVSAPASYASAPPAGHSGIGTDRPVSATYESAPPQVVGQHDDLPEDSLSIGRSRSNSIVLDDMLVSRRHVLITADEEGLLLRDLGSRNGTFVNGRRVEQTHLHEGDRIGIGASTFEVRDGWLVSV